MHDGPGHQQPPQLTFGDKTPRPADLLRPTVGPDVIDIRRLYADGDVFTYDPGFTSTGRLRKRHHLHRRRQGRAALPRLSDRAAGREVAPISRSATCCSTASCRPPRSSTISRTASPATPCCTSRCTMFFRGFRRDAHPMAIDGRRGRRDVGLLSRLDRHHRPLAARGRGDPHDRQDADDRRHGPTSTRSASRSSIRATALDYAVELPAHVLRGAGRGLCGQPDPGQAMDRIFMLHADHEQNASTSTVRLAGSSGANPVRLHRRRHRLPLGPGARRRQRGLPGDAAARSARSTASPNIIASAKDKNDPLPADGLRPPGLQELRPAREGDEAVGRRGARTARHPQQPDAAGRQGTRADRAARTTTSSSKKLYPNVDFYSGIILEAMGFPTSMFTPIFALSRTVGWISQWKEMIEDPTAEDRPAAPALHRADQARLRRDRRALSASANASEAAPHGRLPSFRAGFPTRRPPSGSGRRVLLRNPLGLAPVKFLVVVERGFMPGGALR